MTETHQYETQKDTFTAAMKMQTQPNQHIQSMIQDIQKQ